MAIGVVIIDRTKLAFCILALPRFLGFHPARRLAMVECTTVFSLIFRTVPNAPAWYKCKQTTDSSDADFIIVDHPAQAVDSFEVTGGEAPMPRAPAVRYYQALALVHADCGDREAEQVGCLTDRVQSIRCH